MYPHTLLISIEHQRGHREWKWSRLSNFFYLRSGAMATLPKALAFSAAHRRTIQSGWVSSGFGCFVVCLNHFEPGLNIFAGHLYQLKQSRKCVTWTHPGMRSTHLLVLSAYGSNAAVWENRLGSHRAASCLHSQVFSCCNRLSHVVNTINISSIKVFLFFTNTFFHSWAFSFYLRLHRGWQKSGKAMTTTSCDATVATSAMNC